MKNVPSDELKKVSGGTTVISGPIINAIVGVITLIEDIGKGFGSSIRRIIDNNLCTLEWKTL